MNRRERRRVARNADALAGIMAAGDLHESMDGGGVAPVTHPKARRAVREAFAAWFRMATADPDAFALVDVRPEVARLFPSIARAPFGWERAYIGACLDLDGRGVFHLQVASSAAGTSLDHEREAVRRAMAPAIERARRSSGLIPVADAKEDEA